MRHSRTQISSAVTGAIASRNRRRRNLGHSLVGLVAFLVLVLVPAWGRLFTGNLTAHGRTPLGARHARQARQAESAPMLWQMGPVEIRTGRGQKALYLLKDDPLLFDASLQGELETLAHEVETQAIQQASLQEPTEADTLALRRRMSEVRAKERVQVITELLYLQVCSRFRSLRVPLISTVKDGGNVRFGAVDLKSLTSDVYSGHSLEIVRDHLLRIIGQSEAMSDSAILAMPLFQAGQVYLLSLSFGYYLRRAEARFQLDKLAGGVWDESADEFSGTTSLKEYISAFGPQDVQSLWSVSSLEAQMAMKEQISSLFGDLAALKVKLMTALGEVNTPEEAATKLETLITNKEVEYIRITTHDLRRLVLEAVAFGSLLNDAERQFDSVYELTPAVAKPPFDEDMSEGRMLSG
mmetsp:Transcript_34738/g.92756  ORF Transcript_34738/g.92756 Transcript_34738/m.92756 type:complete len:410 (-) Transcript_34738:118-1347(-)|eukprot:CAMPEP_0194547880 /NCGR_PEP_ID=MMETSP0253-20130528/92801_1 /TAXON_ID=2966 /ORGANISM="Noctiluca scintillans" /LENGTH=409 /DNA_ID=CAMNT_0039395137 /DNA_START=11 /DNA_END=1240 /DNA_ORIENTATION=+